MYLRSVSGSLAYPFRYFYFALNRIFVNFEAFWDQKYLETAYPFFKEVQPEIITAKKFLARPYQNYTTSVSPKTMAISFPLATFLSAFCKLIRPNLILDLGSGFSSFVFRHHALNTSSRVNIWSVDDNQMWLKRTKQFLGEKLTFHHLLTWKEFQAKNKLKFDLVLHDLGTLEIRYQTLIPVLKLIKPGGFIILDDLHLPNFSPQFKQTVKKSGLELRSLRNYTVDQYRRFASIVF